MVSMRRWRKSRRWWKRCRRRRRQRREGCGREGCKPKTHRRERDHPAVDSRRQHYEYSRYIIDTRWHTCNQDVPLHRYHFNCIEAESQSNQIIEKPLLQQTQTHGCTAATDPWVHTSPYRGSHLSDKMPQHKHATSDKYKQVHNGELKLKDIYRQHNKTVHILYMISSVSGYHLF